MSATVIELDQVGAASILRIEGDVTSASEGDLMAAYGLAAANGATVVVLDFSKLAYMNSGGIGLLVTLLVRAQRGGGRLVATGLGLPPDLRAGASRRSVEIPDDRSAAVAATADRGGTDGRDQADPTNEAPASQDAANWAAPVDRLSAAGGGGKTTPSQEAGLGAVTGLRPALAEDLLRPARQHRYHAEPWSRPGRRTSRVLAEGPRAYAPCPGSPSESLLEDPAGAGPRQALDRRPRPLRRRQIVHVHDTRGHTLSAWITFSARRDGDVTIAETQALERPSDPFDELAYMLGGNRQNKILGDDAPQPGGQVGVAVPSRSRAPASTATGIGAIGATSATARPCGQRRT
jgi:anti-anti-sigma factor